MRATLLFSVMFGACVSAQAAHPDLWTVPVPVVEVNSSAREWSPFLSYDGLTLYFARCEGRWRIYEAKRDTPSGPFTTVQEVPGSLNGSPRGVCLEWVSPDNLRMYYTDIDGSFVLYVSERSAVEAPWPLGRPILELNSLGHRLVLPRLTPDERTVVFSASDIHDGQGQYDLWMATRPDRNAPFENVTNLKELNTPANEHSGYLTADGLTLYFSSDRGGSHALFRATRSTTDSPFDPPVHLALFDISGFSQHPALAPDGSALYFMAQRGSDPNTQDIWVSYSGSGFPPDQPVVNPVPGVALPGSSLRGIMLQRLGNVFGLQKQATWLQSVDGIKLYLRECAQAVRRVGS